MHFVDASTRNHKISYSEKLEGEQTSTKRFLLFVTSGITGTRQY